ncbi:MAG: PorV/PorQ family protein [Bacteroidia bacterium]
MKNRIKVFVVIVLSLVLNDTYSQGNIVNIGGSGSPINTIRTGAPILSINTNPQAMGMGYIGVVASELNTQNGFDQNPALLSCEEDVFGAQLLNYSPHARNSAVASRLFESGIYASIGKHSFSVSSRYMLLPESFITDIFGNVSSSFTPSEFFVSGSYAYKFSKNFSIGASLKYLHSDFTGGNIIQGNATMPANVIAGDIGLSYRKTLKETENFKLKWNLGLSVLNIGSKVRYIESAEGDFLPQTLKLGSLFTLLWKKENNNYFAIDFAYQADKLLVPTPPIYAFCATPQSSDQRFYDLS